MNLIWSCHISPLWLLCMFHCMSNRVRCPSSLLLPPWVLQFMCWSDYQIFICMDFIIIYFFPFLTLCFCLFPSGLCWELQWPVMWKEHIFWFYGKKMCLLTIYVDRQAIPELLSWVSMLLPVTSHLTSSQHQNLTLAGLEKPWERLSFMNTNTSLLRGIHFHFFWGGKGGNMFDFCFSALWFTKALWHAMVN